MQQLNLIEIWGTAADYLDTTDAQVEAYVQVWIDETPSEEQTFDNLETYLDAFEEQE